MDAHSGGMSGSTSNSKLVKKSLGSSIRRPVVHSGPLEHQQGSDRPAPLDRMVNSLDYLLGTNDHAHPHSPSTPPSSSLTDNINHHLPRRTLNIHHPRDSQSPTSSHNRLIGAGLGFAIMILLSISICIWISRRHRQDRNARNADVEAVGEAISAPKDDARNANPFADLKTDSIRPPLTYQLWRRDVFSRNNPFHDRHAVVPSPPTIPVTVESATEEDEAIKLSEKR